jgi:hypothetical protein
MLRYRAMHSEYYGLLFGRKISSADGALHAFDAHIGPVNNVRHLRDRITESAYLDAGRAPRANLFCLLTVNQCPACTLM